MASFIGQATAQGTTGLLTTGTISGSPAAGDAIIVAVHMKNGLSVSSVTDSVSNTYTSAGTAAQNGVTNTKTQIYFCTSVTGTPTTVSVTTTGTGGVQFDVHASAFRPASGMGFARRALGTGYGTANGAATTTPTAATVNAMAAGDTSAVIVGAITYPNTTAPTLNTGSGGTSGFNALTGVAQTSFRGDQAYRIVTSTAFDGVAYGPSWTTPSQPYGCATLALVEIDNVAPVLSSASITGATLSLTYNESLALAGDPSLTMSVNGGAPISVNATSSSVAGTTVTMTMASAVVYGNTVTATYTGSQIQDAAGNQAATFAGVAVTNLTPAAVSASDSLPLTATATRTASTARAVADSLSLTDVATATRTTARSVVDVLGLTDAATRAITTSRTGSETLSLVDAATRTESQGRGAADSLPLVDTATRTNSGSRSVTDFLALVDIAARNIGVSRTIADTLALGDAATRSTSQARTASDALPLADGASALTGSSVSGFDSLPLADSATRLVQVARSGAVSLVLTDDVGRSVLVARSVADLLLLVDVASAVVSPVGTRRDLVFTARLVSGRWVVELAPPRWSASVQPGRWSASLTAGV